MQQPERSLAFGRFSFDPHAHVLQRDGRPVELGTRALEVLSVLIQANGGLVEKGTLMDRVWPNVAVEENNLQVQVSALRKVLGDARDLIRTIPGRGYQFTGQLRPESGRRGGDPAPAAEGRPVLSIVVLPFLNISDDPGLDYIVDGLTDSLITDLSRALPGSFVISRSTAFTYKGRSVTTREVGEQVGVQYLLEGSVMPAGETIRINAQLIDAVSDMHLWAERFDKPRADVLLVQDEIVGRLSRSIGLQMERQHASRSQGTQNPEAMDLVLQAYALVHQRLSRDTSEQAMALFRRALTLDPAHVEAQAGLASVLVYQVVNFYRQDRDEPLDEAVRLLETALAADPSHLGALKTRGAVLRARGSFMAAIAVGQAVIAQNPGEPTAYREIGLNKLYLGDLAEAVTWFEGADRIAPLDPSRWTWLQGLGRTLIGLGRDDEALAVLQTAVENRPGVPEIFGLLAAAEALAGHAERARERLEDYAAREPGMTIGRWAARSHVPLQHVSPAYIAANQRLLDGLRLAGMAEG